MSWPAVCSLTPAPEAAARRRLSSAPVGRTRMATGGPDAPPNAESPLDRAGSAVDLQPVPLRLEAPLPRWPLLVRRAVALHTRPPRHGRKRKKHGSRRVVLTDHTDPRLARPPHGAAEAAGQLGARAHLVCRGRDRPQSRRSRGGILPLRTTSERLAAEPDTPVRDDEHAYRVTPSLSLLSRQAALAGADRSAPRSLTRASLSDTQKALATSERSSVRAGWIRQASRQGHAWV